MRRVDGFANEGQSWDFPKDFPCLMLKGLRKMIGDRLPLRDHSTLQRLKDKSDFCNQVLPIQDKLAGFLKKLRIRRNVDSVTLNHVSGSELIHVQERRIMKHGKDFLFPRGIGVSKLGTIVSKQFPCTRHKLQIIRILLIPACHPFGSLDGSTLKVDHLNPFSDARSSTALGTQPFNGGMMGRVENLAWKRSELGDDPETAS
jgi:hypothetical protein